MRAFIVSEDIIRTSNIYSNLGSRILSGNVEALKWFYANAWKEYPPMIKTISMLQDRLTADEIEKDTEGIYCNEFLYYLGMLNLGELSNLIFKDLGTAEICFRKIQKKFPRAKARLAFIELLKTNEPSKSDSNVARLDVLRQWAGRKDFFSRIILAKIVFYQFLNEDQAGNDELPIKLYRLLELPCQNGHPVAVRFWNELLDYIQPINAMDMRISESRMDGDALYDYLV